MKMKKVIPLLVATSLIFSSCGSTEEVTSTDENTYTAVKTTELELSDINKTVSYTGKFEPVEQVSVVAKISGNVENTNANIGDQVSAGQTLYSVDSSDIDIAVESA